VRVPTEHDPQNCGSLASSAPDTNPSRLSILTGSVTVVAEVPDISLRIVRVIASPGIIVVVLRPGDDLGTAGVWKISGSSNRLTV
jgi:hypothetical protein